jgi:hypothetical protein
MAHRQSEFEGKFADAAKHLNCTPVDLVSLKLRENVANYQEYRRLLQELGRAVGVRSSQIQGSFRGTGYLVENSKTKVIIVEHETGLEILYIAGSIASLLGLVPLILRCWSVVRNHHLGRWDGPRFQSIETRRIDRSGVLFEERVDALDVAWAAPLSVMNTAILSAAEIIDAELGELKRTVQLLMSRVQTIEEKSRPKASQPKTAKRKGRKKRTR